MLLNRLNIEYRIFIILFIITPFIQTSQNDGYADFSNLILLPPFVPKIASLLRWFIVGVMIILFFIRFKDKYWRYVTKTNVFFSFFFFVLLLYSTISFSDVFRYLGLFLESIAIPIITLFAFKSNHERFLHFLSKYVFIMTLIGVLLNGKVILLGYRYQGLMDNPNMYGMVSSFWLALIFMKTRILKSTALDSITIGLLLITVFLSGSRNGMFSCFIVIAVFYNKYLLRFIIPCLLSLVILYYLSGIVNLDFLFERFVISSDTINTSGRAEVWAPTKFYIMNSFFLGNGMDAPTDLIGSGNIHNVYLRFLLTMGFLFTFISLSIYFFAVIRLYVLKFREIPQSILGFLLAFTGANFFEDFLVGVGSVMMLYFFFTIGIIGAYELKTTRR